MNEPTPVTQSNSNLYLVRWAMLFVVIFPLSFPFDHGGFLPDIGAYTQNLFEPLARFTGDVLLGRGNYISMLVSDTAGFYLNALNVLFITAVLAFIWFKWFSKSTDEQKWQYRLLTFIRYYLAWQMLLYGWAKVFKAQFYLPEPNTLFTPLGYLHKDILYWSAMGSSYSYTVFAGITEVLAAVLLLSHRTALPGILLTTGIMINVLMINIGFDISVKLYSCFLLLLCTVFLCMHACALYRFFILQVPALVQNRRPTISKKIHYPLKVLVVLILLTDALWPYLQTGNYNDDVYPRPYLHGAYQVSRFNSTHQRPAWKKFFIHRRGYFIVQHNNDHMQDFQLKTDQTNHRLLLTTHDSANIVFMYRVIDNHLELEGLLYNDTVKVTGEKINLEALPLLQPEFGWTVEE